MRLRAPDRPLSIATLPTALLAAALGPGMVLAPPAAGQSAGRDVDALRERAWAAIEARQDELTGLSDRLWHLAETSLEEHRSAATLADYLEREGFEVTRGVAGMPTAFVARWGGGAPVIGILAEYDALPGISNVAEPHRAPLEPGAGGHGCGHNLFGSGSAGAAVAAKSVMEADGRPVRVAGRGDADREGVHGEGRSVRRGRRGPGLASG